MEIWESILLTLKPESKITGLTNGPLTNLANTCTLNDNIIKNNKVKPSATLP